VPRYPPFSVIHCRFLWSVFWKPLVATIGGITLLAALGACATDSEAPVDVENIRRPRIWPGKYPVWGLDLSHHQSRVDWVLLAEDPPHFVYLKATEGTTHRDSRFADYRAKARSLGIATGAYHFFSYSSSGEDQARFFAAHAPLEIGDLPPVLDLEPARRMPVRGKIRVEIDDFLETYERITGVRPILYAGCIYARDFIRPETESAFLRWVPDYNTPPLCGWLFWQSSETHRQLGIDGPVDFNIFVGNTEMLQQICLR